MQSRQSTMSLGRIVCTVLEHKVKVGCFFTAIMAIAVLVIMLGKATYRSQAQLLVRLGRENVVIDPTATGRADISCRDSVIAGKRHQFRSCASQEPDNC